MGRIGRRGSSGDDGVSKIRFGWRRGERDGYGKPRKRLERSEGSEGGVRVGWKPNEGGDPGDVDENVGIETAGEEANEVVGRDGAYHGGAAG